MSFSPSSYPFGRAPFWLLVVAIAATCLAFVARPRKDDQSDLVLAVFAGSHLAAYQTALPSFEKAHSLSVKPQLVDWRALEARLQSSILSGTPIPDVVELAPCHTPALGRCCNSTLRP